MTVPSAVSKSGPYTGNGVTTSFAYGFRILDQSHIRVVRTENGIDTILTSGFSVLSVGAAGGSVLFSVAPTAAQTITLIRNAPFTQQTDLENQGAYYAQTIEDALDLGVMRDQQLQEQVDRSVKIPVGAATFDLDGLVTDIVRVADSVAAVDTVAANIADVDTVATNIDDVGIVADNIVDVTNFADVYQGPKAVAPVLRNNGQPLLSGDLYFDTVENRMKVRASAAWVNAASSVNGMIAQYAYTATAGQTVFAAVYDIGFVNVYLNGVKLLAGDDFTATNGTTVVLASGAAAGDSIEIIGFGAFSTADMLQKSQNGADILNKAAFLQNLGITAPASVINRGPDPENRIINGAFDIWQRGTSFAAGGYGADRWINTLVGGAATQSRQAFAMGDNLGRNSPAFFLRQTVSGQTLASQLAVTAQKIEGVRTYAGQTITVLGWARRSSGAGNMAVEALQSFGSGGSPSPEVAGIGSAIVPLTAAWSPFAVTMTVPSIAGKTLGIDGNDNFVVNFWTSAGSNFNARSAGLGLQTIGVDLWGIHIRVGTHTVAACDLYVAPELGPELARCQRYFRVGTIYGWGYAINATPQRASLERFGTEMRSIPAIAFFGATYANANTIATDGGPQGNGFGVRVNALAAGQYFVDAAYTADAEI